MVEDMKRRISIVCFLLVLIWLLVVAIKIATVEPNLLRTEDINDYGSEQYPISSTIFPDEIPSNAQVVSFSYYNYWQEAEDIYLELKFYTIQEMERYLSILKSDCIAKCQDYTPPKNGEWFVEEKNIYNESYTDLYFTFYNTSKEENIYTGFIIEKDSEETLYKCNFGLICYSYDELTVIQTYVHGWYQESVHNYIPKYFVRFNIPLDETHKKLIYLEW